MKVNGFFDRRLGRALVRLFLAILLGSGVANPAWAQCDPDPGDDEPSTAVDLVNSCGTDHACLNSDADVDNYFFDLQHRTQIVIETRGDTDTMLKLYRWDGSTMTIIESDNDSGEGHNAWITDILEAGRYYIEVMGYGGATGQYDLVRSGCCGGDDYNDWFTWADDLLSGWTANAQIDCEGDRDFYKIHADAGSGRYEVTLTSNGNWVMCRYDSSGNQLGACSNDSPQVLDLTDGWYGYVEVKAFDDVSTFSYTIAVGTPCGDDPGNDTPSEATDLGSACTTRTADIDCDEDVDYYRFTAPRTGTFTFSVASNDAISITVTDSNGNSLGQSSTSVQASLVSGNVVYVEVEAGVPGQTPSYDLTVSGCSCGYDPGNDTHGTATDLNGHCGMTHEGNDCEGDVDWFRFTAPGDATYTFETTGSTDTVMELYDDQVQIITSDDDSGDGSNARITHQLSMGSTYFVKVRGYSTSTTGQYDLVVSGCPCGNDPGDDDQAHATDLGSSCGTHSAAIDCNDDDDWYRFTVPNDGTFVFRTLGTGSYHTLLSLYVGGVRVEIDTDSVSHALSSGDTVDLLVQSDTGDIFDYQLEITGCSSGGCGGDPGDDDADHATDIGSSCGSRGGSIDCAGDSDYFRFTAPNDGTFTFSASGGATTSIDLEDDQGNPIDSADGSLSHDLVQGQVVAVGLSAADGTSTYDYTFTITGCSSGGCGNDPGDDDADHANDLGSSCGTTGGSIDCAGDRDYFRFTAPNDGTFTFSASGGATTTVDLEDDQGNPIDSADGSLSHDLVQGQVVAVGLSAADGTSTYDYTFTITGCSSGGCGNDPGDDDTAHATDLGSSCGTTNAAMDCAADLDFYRFTPPNDGAFTFTGVGGAAVYLTLLDSSGVQLNGAPGSMTMSLVSGNVYYIEVAPMSSTDPPFNYILEIAGCTAGGCGADPGDDDLAHATDLGGCGTVSAALDCDTDEDWYRFAPPGAGNYQVALGASFQAGFELYDGSGVLLGQSSTDLTTYLDPADGPFAIVVASGTGVTGAYDLTVSGCAAASCGGEVPNDDPATATDLPGTGTWTDAFDCPGDVDFFRFVPAADGTYVFETGGSMDTEMWLRDAGAALIAFDDDGGSGLNSMISSPLIAGQTYYVQLAEHDGRTGAYELTITDVADCPGDVDGDTPAGATALPGTGTYGAAFDCPGDVDYFTFVPDRTVPHTVETTGGMDTTIEISGPGGSTVAAAGGGGTGTNARVQAVLEAGRTYTIRVAEATGATGPYDLVLTAEGGGSAENAYRYLVPAAARVEGVAGTNWSSDLVLSNPGDTAAHATIAALVRDRANPSPTTIERDLDAGETVRIADVLGAFGMDSGAAALLISSDRPLTVASRTFNSVPGGTYGQFIPGLPLERAIAPGTKAYLQGLMEYGGTVGYRSNLGLVNLEDKPLTVTVRFHDSQGDPIGGPREYVLEEHEYIQRTRVLRDVTGADVPLAWAELSADGLFAAYISIVDNATGDPVYRAARPVPGEGGGAVMMGLAKLAGAAGTNWVSDAVFLNPGGATVTIDAELWERDGDSGPAAVASLYLEPGRCYGVGDLLRTLFAMDRGAASLALRFDRGILAAARTYNLVPDGTYGQNIDAYDSWNLLGAGDTGYLVMVRQDGDFRTNLGLMNGLRDATSEVELVLRDFAGQSVGSSVRVELAPGRVMQLDRIAERFTGAAFAGGRLELRVIRGAVLAYGSVVDQHTGDPVFETPTILTGMR